VRVHNRLMILFLLFSLNVAFAKISPLSFKGQLILADDQGIVSYRGKTKLENWRVPLSTPIKTLTLDGHTLQAVDERGQVFKVNALTGMLPRPYLISGFDDVLRQAENTGLIKAGLKLFDPDRTFAGMRELYMLMTSEESNPRFVLISAIGIWFERRITDFLKENRYPTVQLRLRNWLTEFSIESFKMARIAEVVYAHPDRRFIIIFDNSAASLQLTKRVQAEYPNTIQNIYLREVEKKDHPVGSIPFHTSFDIALHEVKARRMSSKEAIVIGYALLEEKDGEEIIPHYAYCPKDYSPCASASGELIQVCSRVQDRIRELCSKR